MVHLQEHRTEEQVMAPKDSPKPQPADATASQEEPAESREPSAGLQKAVSPEQGAQSGQKIKDPGSKRADGIPNVLSAIAGIVGVCSAVSLLLSVIYDWGFFRALDLELRTLPTGLSDHVRAAINWVPATAVSAILAVVTFLLPQRLDRGKSEEVVVKHSRAPRVDRFAYDSWKIMFWVSMLGGPLSYLLFGARYLWLLAVGAMCIWLVFSYWLIKEPPLSRFEFLPLFMGIVLIPAVALLIYFFGSLEGHRAQALPCAHSILIVGHPMPVPVTVLRSIDKGVLVLTPDKKEVQFLPWASVTSIKMHIEPEFHGWLDDWL
jgi:hypothetical protein